MTDKTTAMTELPEPDLGYIETDKSRQPAFSARQMREALRPQAVPMTDEQRQRVFAAAEHRTLAFDNVSWRDAIVDAVEAHHGIHTKGAQEWV